MRTDVGVWDISALRKWQVRGDGAAAAVDRLFTNDVVGAPPGTVRYGLFCDERGMIVNDATVYKLADDYLWVFSSLASDGEHLSRGLGASAIELDEITDRLAAVQVQGPASRELLRRLGADLAALPYYGFIPHPVDVAGAPCWISRVGYSGELGYELFCSPGHAPELWRAVCAQGARPYGLAAVETLRVEAGLLMVGRDFHPGVTSARDVSLDGVVRLDTAFLGRDALCRPADEPAATIWTLVAGDDVVPAAGDLVRAGGVPVGAVTTACRSPTLAVVLALAGLRDPTLAGGRAVTVDSKGGAVSATLAQTPVYDHDKARRRA